VSVEYLVCDECGSTFCDCGEYYCCENCGRQFCCECGEDASLEWDEQDGCFSSCKYCRNEAVDNNDMLRYLLNKYQTTREDVEKEIIEKRKEEKK
jgi:hypothetical protein